jgi:hypothetical protein
MYICESLAKKGLKLKPTETIGDHIMLAKYQIQNPDGSISEQAPVDGAWYCHFTIQPDGFHSDGNIAQCNYIDNLSVEFLGDDGQPVNMVSDCLPCYLVRQN